MPASMCSIPPPDRIEHLRHDPAQSRLAERRPDLHARRWTAPESVWVGTAEGLDRWQPERGAFVHFRHALRRSAHRRAASRSRRSSRIEDGSFWVGTFDGGLDRMDSARTRPREHFATTPNAPASLASDDVRAILEDHAGHLWVGTAEGLDLHGARHRPILALSSRRRGSPNRCAIRWSCRCTRMPPAWSGSARAPAASAAGIRAAGNSAATARIGSAENTVTSFADAPNGKVWIGIDGRRPGAIRRDERRGHGHRRHRRATRRARRPTRDGAAAGPSRHAVDRHDDERAEEARRRTGGSNRFRSRPAIRTASAPPAS